MQIWNWHYFTPSRINALNWFQFFLNCWNTAKWSLSVWQSLALKVHISVCLYFFSLNYGTSRKFFVFFFYLRQWGCLLCNSGHWRTRKNLCWQPPFRWWQTCPPSPDTPAPLPLSPLSFLDISSHPKSSHLDGDSKLPLPLLGSGRVLCYPPGLGHTLVITTDLHFLLCAF